ncbi:MAG TPA: sialidase family protein, partial [Agriterribacter sp.]|nr:sialidase family protein [Agriterribacter sp.]
MKKLFLIYMTLFCVLLSCGDSERSGKATAPVLLSDANNKASCVFLARDEKNQPVISWTETDSTGNKHFYFTSRMPIPIAPNTSIHEEGMPKIAFKGDGTMVAIYETSVPSAKSRFGLSDIQYVMSFDKGKTWTGCRSIQSDVPHTGSRSFGNIIRLDDGEIGVAWLDTDPDDAHSGRPVKFARTNGKDGFGDAVLIESFACQCCRTALSSDGQGNVSVVFRDLLSGSVRDISVSSSANNGRSFSKAVPFSNDQWVIDGCPHNGPSVVSSSEATYVTWFTGSDRKGVFYAALDKNNNMIFKRQLAPNGRFVQLCLMPDGTRIAAYNASYREGDTTYSKIVVN